METQDIYEVWNKDGNGVLSLEPLIMTACKEGKIGSVFSYDGGCIYKTVFTYLCGKPEVKFIAEFRVGGIYPQTPGEVRSPKRAHEASFCCIGEENEGASGRIQHRCFYRRDI